MSLVIVSGTGTDVGKTVTTAALAALARARGERVAVIKPVQTGEPPGTPGDLGTVAALSGVADLHEFARYPDPLSPEAAARRAGRPLDLRAAASSIAALAEERNQVIVEGAGGLLVRYDPAGTTIADLAAMLDAPVLVVAPPALGTLNHTALTLEALAARKLACAGIVIGSWPARPGLAEQSNLSDLATVAGRPLAGILPAAPPDGPGHFPGDRAAGAVPRLRRDLPAGRRLGPHGDSRRSPTPVRQPASDYSPGLGSVEHRDQVTLLHDVTLGDVQPGQRARLLGQHRDLHFHGFENHQGVTGADLLALGGDHLPDVRHHLRSDLRHRCSLRRPPRPASHQSSIGAGQDAWRSIGRVRQATSTGGR